MQCADEAGRRLQQPSIDDRHAADVLEREVDTHDDAGHRRPDGMVARDLGVVETAAGVRPALIEDGGRHRIRAARGVDARISGAVRRRAFAKRRPQPLRPVRLKRRSGDGVCG